MSTTAARPARPASHAALNNRPASGSQMAVANARAAAVNSSPKTPKAATARSAARERRAAAAEAVDEVVAQQGEGAGAQARRVQQVGEQPVPVELDEGNEVEPDVEVTQRGEAVEVIGDAEVGDRGDAHGEAGDGGFDEGPGGGVDGALATGGEGEVGGVDEERRVAEVEQEAGAHDVASGVLDGQRVAELVQQQRDVEQDEQEQRVGAGEVGGDDGRAVGRREGDEAADGERGGRSAIAGHVKTNRPPWR